MLHNHPQADNLFGRLISYSPRIGEANRERTALEDYYTEALAWCLRSPEPRREFFNLIREGLPSQENRLLPQGNESGIEIHTQLSFNQTNDDKEDDEEEEGANGTKRRFDLVIQSSSSFSGSSFVIVVEDKLRWHFTENQIPAYQSELEKGPRFKDFSTKLLVLLSPSGKKPNDAQHQIRVIPLSWSAVQQKLGEFSGGHSRPLEQLKFSAVQFVCSQFADLLKEKGLAPMKIAQANDDQVQRWVEGIEARETMARILAAIRSENGKLSLKKYPVFEQNADDSKWFGMYSSGQEYFYAGFKLCDEHGAPDFCMFIQMKFPDNNARLAEDLVKNAKGRRCAEDASLLDFQEKISASEFDGKADKIQGWFADKIAEISEAQLKFTTPGEG